MDDVQAFLRVETFRNQLFRFPTKFLSLVKWIPYSERFEILKESRKLMLGYKHRFIKKKM